MKLLIVDDEQLARERLRALVAELDAGHEVVGEAADGDSVLRLVEDLQPDIVLLDIHMPGKNGIDVAQQLAELPNPPAVIFATAYDNHALEAFEAQAIAYLLKPVRLEKLAEAIDKASCLREGQLAGLRDLQSRQGRTHLSLHNRGNLERLPLGRVLYFRAEQKYVVVRHEGGEALLDESLVSLEQEFGDQFVRIHRNALVACAALVGMEKDSLGRARAVIRSCDERLDISRRHVAGVRRLLK
jgi:two-component system response regulator AlgR